MTRSIYLALTVLLPILLAGDRASAQGIGPPEPKAPAASLGTAFTYQGELRDGGTPVSGTCDFQFSLHDAVSGGTQVGSVQTVTNVSVAQGRFTVSLNRNAEMITNPFTGDARWLAVRVRCPAGSGEYTALSPRQQIASAPYALGLRPGAVIQSSSSPGLTVDIHGNSPMGVYGLIGNARNAAVNEEAYGVYGWSNSGLGVGVYGESFSYAGVWGRTWDPNAAGVVGWADADGAEGVLGNSPATTGNGAGVYGTSSSPDGHGGFFINASSDGVALHAQGSGANRDKATLRVDNTEPSGGMAAYLTNNSNFANVHLRNSGSGQVLWLQNGGTDASGTGGGDFITAINGVEPNGDIQFRVLTSGEVRSDVGFNTPAADFAEMLPASPGLEPGDVLAVGPDGILARSTRPYQSSVLGVYSTRPGFLGGQPVDGELEGHVPLAVVGVVPVKASAENGPIQPGDLLTTSSTPGHAMRAGLDPAVGTVLGKALEPLDKETGVIRMLVILQ